MRLVAQIQINSRSVDSGDPVYMVAELSAHHGPDSAFSLEPREFAAMVDAVRTAERALGAVHFGPSAHEPSSLAFRRSLFVVENVRQGDVFSRTMVRAICPSQGLHTPHMQEIFGRKASRDIERRTPLSWDLVGKS